MKRLKKQQTLILSLKLQETYILRLSQNTWLNPISELREYIMESYNNSKWHFRISESIERTASQKGKLMESLNADLTSLLNESDVKSKFSVVAAKHPWSMDAKAIVNEMNAEDKKLHLLQMVKVVSVLSPVLESEEGINIPLTWKELYL